ncbi:MAG TPA: hypothetical protein PLU35_02085 [Phycisphaerales bacterium]|nr:hypothetical protein [Phycisphaerales bacterium]
MNTRTMMRFGAFGAAAALFCAQHAAGQTPIISYTYSDLDGSFDVSTMMFDAKVVSNTSGDVTRLVGGGGTAEFNAGDWGSTAGYMLSLKVGPIDPNGDRSGSGTFVSTDAFGDTISGLVDGRWIDGGNGVVFFNGYLENVLIADNSGDSRFDGTTSGHFATNFQGPIAPFSGAIVLLQIQNPPDFFGSDFSGVPTLVSALIVPSPGALALALACGTLAVRRRR